MTSIRSSNLDNRDSMFAEAEHRVYLAAKYHRTTLDLSGLRLTSLPASLWEIQTLKVLHINDNQLTELPIEIGQLKSLRWIKAEANWISSLPESFRRLKDLEWLSLAYNQMVCIPDWIGELGRINELYLHSNRLAVLPEAMAELKELSILMLHKNGLTLLPDGFARLKKLQILTLWENPKLGIPDEVLNYDAGSMYPDSYFTPQRPPSKILEYYFSVQGAAGRSLDECKLIVIGRGTVGKTTLVKRLNGLLMDVHERETHGVTIQKLKFECKNGPVTARVWDFGGQIVLHSMHKFFFTARSLYLLVVGGRDDMLERDVTYWLQLIRSYAGDAPVVIAINKSEGRQRQFDRITLEKNYGPILGWVSTECSERDAVKGHITELRETLTAALDGSYMDSVRRKFPAKWFSIKDSIEEMKESFLDYNSYAARCAVLGVENGEEQAALASDLHDLGVALNYSRDSRLRDTTVLRPDWLANGIYAVLRANVLDDRLPTHLNVELASDGIVTVDTMELIHAKAAAWKMLHVSDYPEGKRVFLLRLMELFQLCYPVGMEGNSYLVPALLQAYPPSGTEEPEEPDRIRIRYEFQVVPAPLIPCFIARAFSLIPDRKHWRRGGIFMFGKSLARIWTTQDERYVFVTIGGEREDREDLLTMIRGTFSDLFLEYQALQVTEQWEHDGEWVPRKTLEEFGRLEADSLCEHPGEREHP